MPDQDAGTDPGKYKDWDDYRKYHPVEAQPEPGAQPPPGITYTGQTPFERTFQNYAHGYADAALVGLTSDIGWIRPDIAKQLNDVRTQLHAGAPGGTIERYGRAATTGAAAAAPFMATGDLMAPVGGAMAGITGELLRSYEAPPWAQTLVPPVIGLMGGNIGGLAKGAAASLLHPAQALHSLIDLFRSSHPAPVAAATNPLVAGAQAGSRVLAPIAGGQAVNFPNVPGSPGFADIPNALTAPALPMGLPPTVSMAPGSPLGLPPTAAPGALPSWLQQPMPNTLAPQQRLPYMPTLSP